MMLAPCRKLSEVMAGLDFNATSGWALVLPASLLQGARNVTLWAGAPGGPRAQCVVDGWGGLRCHVLGSTGTEHAPPS